MRRFLIAIALLSALPALAQQSTQPSEDTNWQYVQALRPGARLYIKAKTRHASCKLKKDDDSTLTCISGAKDIVFDRTEILTIKIPAHSMLGLGVRASIGALIGIGGCSGAWNGCSPTDAAMLGGAGAIIGISTGLTRSTVYRAH